MPQAFHKAPSTSLTHLPFNNLPFLLNQISDTSTVSNLPVPQTCWGARVGGVSTGQGVRLQWLNTFWCSGSAVRVRSAPSSPKPPLLTHLAPKQSLYPPSSLFFLFPHSTLPLQKAWVKPASVSQRKPEEAQGCCPRNPDQRMAGWVLFVFPVIRKSHKGESRGTLSCQGGWDPD